MQSTDVIQPTAIQTPIAVNGDKNIPSQTASGSDTSSINLGFLPITSEPLDDGGIAPERTDFNGMFYLATDQRVFLQNGGVITYDSDVATSIGGYPLNAMLGVIDSSGNLGIVRSLQENNQYDFVTNPSYIDGQKWEYVYLNNFSLLDFKTGIGIPQFTLNFTSNLPSGCVDLNGAAVSRTTYASLFAIYGTTYGEGNGSTTFNLPDFRNRVIWGSTTAGYLTAGLPSLSTDSAGSHSHTFTGTTQTGYAYCLGNANSPCDGSMCSNTGTLSTESQGDGGSGKDARMNITITPSGSIGYAGSHSHTISSSVSGILGAASTVQPPAIKIRVFTRYE